jgi:hypothetical protein
LAQKVGICDENSLSSSVYLSRYDPGALEAQGDKIHDHKVSLLPRDAGLLAPITHTKMKRAGCQHAREVVREPKFPDCAARPVALFGRHIHISIDELPPEDFALLPNGCASRHPSRRRRWLLASRGPSSLIDRGVETTQMSL